jgi:hypothetical protein
MDRFLRLARRSPIDLLTLIVVTFLLAVIRIGLIVLPFPTLRRTLDKLAGAPNPQRVDDPEYQSRIVWATLTASPYLLPDKPCLTQALTVQLLLRRKGIPAQLRIGVKKDGENKLLAHAWVDSEGTIVIGGSKSELDEYKLLPALDVKSR